MVVAPFKQFDSSCCAVVCGVSNVVSGPVEAMVESILCKLHFEEKTHVENQKKDCFRTSVTKLRIGGLVGIHILGSSGEKISDIAQW